MQTYAELMARVAAKKARISELARTTAATAWKSGRFSGSVVVCRNTHPSCPPWRLTILDLNGTPTGHLEAHTYEQALAEVAAYGVDVFEQPLRALPV